MSTTITDERPTDPCGYGVLTSSECAYVLEEAKTGHLAMIAGDRAHLVPVSYGYEVGVDVIVLGEVPDDVEDGALVALEVDGGDHGRPGWTVIVQGRASAIGPREVPRSVRGWRPRWAGGSRTAGLRIQPDAITGRVIS
jgi:nitroimidazol reductase NimA-like FMN-containing flavoprotein (pyridoxamine 5'-phosphate oxidase superfamily)